MESVLSGGFSPFLPPFTRLSTCCLFQSNLDHSWRSQEQKKKKNAHTWIPGPVSGTWIGAQEADPFPKFSLSWTKPNEPGKQVGENLLKKRKTNSACTIPSPKILKWKTNAFPGELVWNIPELALGKVDRNVLVWESLGPCRGRS